MTLFHVSYDPIPRFQLRVPEYRLVGEDDRTPRICLSDSIERCVNAKPSRAEALYLAKKYGLRMPLYVYEFEPEDIPAGALVGPWELTGWGKVSDAELYHEHWLLDANVPYREVRYEFVGGIFLPPEEASGHPSVLHLGLSQEESEEARRLEQFVWNYNQAELNGLYLTTDCIISNCVEQIAEMMHRKPSLQA